MENLKLSSYLKRLVPNGDYFKTVDGEPNSIIIKQGEGIILFPEEGNRKFKITIYNCSSNQLKFVENIVIPSYPKIGSNNYSYCSCIYGFFMVGGKKGVFYCHSGTCSTAVNLLKNVLKHYGNFDTMEFTYIPQKDMDSNKLYEKIDILKNVFNDVFGVNLNKVNYRITSNNFLDSDYFHVPLSI